MNIAKPMLICAGLALGTAHVAMAQPALYDAGLLGSECLRADCIQATRAALDAILAQHPDADALNSQIGVLAAALFAVAKQAAPGKLAEVAQSLELLASISSDGAQRQSLLLLARQIGAGDVGLFDLDTPFAASPA